MTLLAAQTLTVTRYATGTIVAGDYTDSVESTFSITGTLRPLNGRDRQMLPEGTRLEELLKLYTTTALRMIDPIGPRQADRVSDGTDTWEVQRAFDNSRGPLPHWKYYLRRIAEDES